MPAASPPPAGSLPRSARIHPTVTGRSARLGRRRGRRRGAAGAAPATSDQRPRSYFAFEALGRRSTAGRTRTAPAGALDRLRFAVASYATFDQGFFNAHAPMAEDDVDAVLHLGDHVYGPRSTGSTPTCSACTSSTRRRHLGRPRVALGWRRDLPGRQAREALHDRDRDREILRSLWATSGAEAAVQADVDGGDGGGGGD